jgi:hypothetical protein
LQFANDTGDEAIEPCTNKAAQPEAMGAGATNKKPTKQKKQNKTKPPPPPPPPPSSSRKTKNTTQKRKPPLLLPTPTQKPKNKDKIHKNFTTQKILHTQVRSKIAIVSLSLLSLVLYLGVFCDGDNLWCVCVGVLYL